MWYDSLSLWTEISQNVATTAAIGVGGWWSYRRFIKGRLNAPHARINHTIVVTRLSNSTVLLRVGIVMENVGHVLLKWDKGMVRVQQVAPCPAHWLKAFGEQLNAQAKVGWPLLGQRQLANQQQELEPNETDAMYFDFFLDSSIEIVAVYSYIPNRTKENVGWNHTTIHDLSIGDSTMGQREERQGPAEPPTRPPEPSPAERRPADEPRPMPARQGPEEPSPTPVIKPG